MNEPTRRQCENVRMADRADTPRPTIGPFRAVATFTVDPHAGPFWSIEFPDGLSDLALPGADRPGIATVGDAHTKEDARQSARWLACAAHNDCADPSQVVVNIEWRNESAYENWLADRGRDAGDA